MKTLQNILIIISLFLMGCSGSGYEAPATKEYGAKIEIQLRASEFAVNDPDCTEWQFLQVVLFNDNGFSETKYTNANGWVVNTTDQNGGKDFFMTFSDITEPGMYYIEVYESNGLFVKGDERQVNDNYIEDGSTYKEYIGIVKADLGCL